MNANHTSGDAAQDSSAVSEVLIAALRRIAMNISGDKSAQIIAGEALDSHQSAQLVEVKGAAWVSNVIRYLGDIPHNRNDSGHLSITDDELREALEIYGPQVPAAPAVALPTNDTVYAEVQRQRGDLNQYVSTNAVNDVMAAVRALAAQPTAAVTVTSAAKDVLAERQRQMSVEGWTPEHDDEHADDSLAMAAICYAMPKIRFIEDQKPQDVIVDISGGRGDTPKWARKPIAVPIWWPESWRATWWKPKDRRRNLVRAGALILAEIERLDRAAAKQGGAQ